MILKGLFEPSYALLKVLELLQIAEPDGTQLGHIMDHIKAARGGFDGLISETDTSNFYGSINKREGIRREGAPRREELGHTLKADVSARSCGFRSSRGAEVAGRIAVEHT
jgi:hypothetical protein